MDTRKITVRHASGTYTLEVGSKAFDKACKKISAIIKGKNRSFKYRPDPDTLQVLPAEMLRQSVITFGPKKTVTALLPQGTSI